MLKNMRYGDDALAFKVLSEDFNGITCPAGMNLNERNRDPTRERLLAACSEKRANLPYRSFCHDAATC